MLIMIVICAVMLVATGNFAKSAHFVRFKKLTREQFQRPSAKFPTQQNRELFGRDRSNPKSSPDEVFGTHSGHDRKKNAPARAGA